MIIMEWLSSHGEAEFERFQSYGEGKLKLIRLNAEELLASLSDDPPELLAAYVEQLRQRASPDIDAFQSVVLDSTFSGITVRQMAEEADLMDEYRQVYQPTSGILHGEWWALTEYVMERCRSPLHRFHWVPTLDPTAVEPRFPEPLLGRLSDLIAAGLSALGLKVPDANDPQTNATDSGDGLADGKGPSDSTPSTKGGPDGPGGT